VAGGGGIFIATTGSVSITGSEITGNSAVGDGGGLLNTSHTPQMTISSCTFNGNRAGGFGGGLSFENGGNANLTNVTISGNSAMVDGGGIAVINVGVFDLESDTIVFNAAGKFGGGVSAGPASSTRLHFLSTIVAKNTAAKGGDPDVDNLNGPAIMDDGGGNFIGDNTGATDSFPVGTPNANGSFVGRIAVASPPFILLAPLDPLLDPLADNGGTVVLPDGSHLLTHQDQANNGTNGVRDRIQGLAAVPDSDERGFLRRVGAGADIGAFEFQDFDVTLGISAPAGPVRAGLPATFVLGVTNNGRNPSHGVTATATLAAGTVVVSAPGSFTVSGNVVTFAVPDLAAGASIALTLTVIPAAPGPFTATGALSAHDDPNSVNNTASVSLVVLPRPFPATGFADVTALVQIVQQGRRRRPQKRLLFRITNVSATQLQGPLGLVVIGLRPRRGPQLRNASGLTTGRQPFVRLDIGGDNLLDPSESLVVQLVFSQPFLPRRLRVLAGAFA
jgi:uncharacterized repeat protein (TIGR01451 family)